MKVRSFCGNSVKDALDKARRELGPDAAIIASRQLRPEEGGGCEVVCGTDEEIPSCSSDRPARANTRNDAGVAGTPTVLDHRRRSVESRQGSTRRDVNAGLAPLHQSGGSDACEAVPGPVPHVAPKGRFKGAAQIRKRIEALVHPADDGFGSDQVRAELVAAGFADDLANEIVAGVRQRQRLGTECRSALLEEISTRLTCAPHLGAQRAERRIVAFVGPPGAGKTTTLVKLAVRYGLRSRKPMHIISMDSWRIGGADALRTYAAGMGVTFELIETAEALRQSLEEHSGKGLILIDTPGLAPADLRTFAPVASVLSTDPQAEAQLVVPAYAAPSAMASIAQRFRAFLPSKLIVTSADCGESCLSAAALSVSLDKPVSFIGTGQMIPEDIEGATAERLLGIRAADGTKTATSAA